MSKEELMEYVGNEIKKYEERIKNLSDEYFLPNEYKTHLTKDGYFKGRKDSYNSILEKLKEEDDKEELNKKKYYIKGKFYLKGGAIVEDYCSPNGIDINVYDTEYEALEAIQYIYEEVINTKIDNKLFIINKHAILPENLLYFSLEPEEVIQ